MEFFVGILIGVVITTLINWVATANNDDRAYRNLLILADRYPRQPGESLNDWSRRIGGVLSVMNAK